MAYIDEDLLPCPFCGGVPYLTGKVICNTERTYTIHCSNCGCQLTHTEFYGYDINNEWVLLNLDIKSVWNRRSER